jgi:hypothetical protein
MKPGESLTGVLCCYLVGYSHAVPNPEIVEDNLRPGRSVDQPFSFTGLFLACVPEALLSEIDLALPAKHEP